MLALLQFDASSRPVIERMLAEGKLPALAELTERGPLTALGRSTPLFVEAGSYVSLYSGREVGDHGIYSAFLWSPEEQRVRFMNVFPTPPATWDALGDAGRRSLVIDPYESWPARNADGLWLLNGWQFRQKLLLHISRPRGAQTRLALRKGRAPALEHLYGRQSGVRLLKQRAGLLGAPGRAADAVEALGSKRPDLIWITFSAAHFAGHYYWDVDRAIDGGVDSVDSEGRRQLAGTLEDAYVAVDQALGRVMRALPAGADVIAFSPIGMGPETSRSDLLPAMLRAVLDGGGTRLEAGAEEDPSAIWKLRARFPLSWRLALARPLPRGVVRNLTAGLQLRGTDWGEVRAFALPGDHSGYVRLNLAGRERDGIVDPADAAGLIDEISAGLASFSDPDGTPTIAAVERVAEQIAGERSAWLPDLVVRWNDRPSAGQTGVTSAQFGDIPRPGVGTGRTGNHNTDAWAVLAPGAASLRELGREPRIIDLPATAAALLGADPTGTAGEPLLQAP